MTRLVARPAVQALLLGAALLGAAPPGHAQGLGVEGGWYSGSRESYFVLSAGTARRISGPLGLALNATWYSPDGGGGWLLGAGADLSLWRGGRPGLYAIGGVSGGFGFNGADVFWGAYSIGLGYDFRLFSAVGLGVDLRWKGLSQGGDEGWQVGVRLGGGMQRKGMAAAPAPASDGGASGATAPPGVPPTAVASAAVETALGAMGTPYAWGGSSANGFDCSGLIQYAYGAHGVALPRTSADQARAGVGIERDLAALAPGDILTFSSSAGGTQVSHVGLYIGGGEFIHSATNGVQKSRLSATDPYGKWWWQRWVGARRVAGG